MIIPAGSMRRADQTAACPHMADSLEENRMEYREGRCPKCNEVMQIPVGRERIICMFCGQEFSVAEGKEASEAVYQTEMEKWKGLAGTLFQNIEKTVKGFQRNEYEGAFQKYLMDQTEALQTIRRTMQTAPDQSAAGEEIAGTIVERAEKLMEEHKGKLSCKNTQMTLNMYMVTFVLPAILSLDQKAYASVTEQICTKWAATFKDSNIQAADFESLCSGFRKKLCYITTAVCEGLHKPEDCYELKLLKQYRDGYLAAAEDGELLIHEYYDMAPTIVKRVGKKENREEIYRFLYETYIDPCVHFIENGENEACRQKYQEMVELLQQEYLLS